MALYGPSDPLSEVAAPAEMPNSIPIKTKIRAFPPCFMVAIIAGDGINTTLKYEFCGRNLGCEKVIFRCCRSAAPRVAKCCESDCLPPRILRAELRSKRPALRGSRHSPVVAHSGPQATAKREYLPETDWTISRQYDQSRGFATRRDW